MKIPRDISRFSRRVTEIMPLILREFAKREDNELSRGKISFPQMVVIDYVAHHRRVNMSDLARLLSVKTSSASVLIDRLIRQGVLKRSRDVKDRRIIWVHITAKGSKIIGRIMKQKQLSIRRLFTPLSAGERNQYLAVLEKINRHLHSQNLTGKHR